MAPLPPSLWAATAEPAPATPPLEGEARAEVAIVGGGFTGLSAALHLAESGVEAALVEASEPGWGASGRNGGQVIPGTKYAPDALATKFGPERGPRLAAFAEATADFAFALIERHAILCDARRCGWIKGAHSAAMLEVLKRQVETRRDGAVELLDAPRLAPLLGTDAYAGGLLDRRGGSLQPLSYARGLARAALRHGARIHGGSPARRIVREGDRWVIEGDRFHLRAPRVLIATNAYTDDLWPGLRRTVIPVNSVQIATAPLPEDARRNILPERHVLSDTRRLLLYFRLDAAGRLVFGGRGSVRDGSQAASYAAVGEAMRRIFPAAAKLPREFAWAGRVALNLDTVPHVSLLAPGIVAAMGYNGRGVAMASALGAAVAQYLKLGGDTEIPYPLEPMRAVPLHGLRLPALALATQFYRLRDALGV